MRSITTDAAMRAMVLLPLLFVWHYANAAECEGTLHKSILLPTRKTHMRDPYGRAGGTGTLNFPARNEGTAKSLQKRRKQALYPVELQRVEHHPLPAKLWKRSLFILKYLRHYQPSRFGTG